MSLKMKAYLAIILFALFGLTAMADDNAQYIMDIHFADGAKEEYIVAEQPTVSFDKTYVYVKTKTLSVQFPTQSVVDYTFRQTVSTDVEDVKMEDKAHKLSIKYVDGRTVIVRGMDAKGKISVYALDGKKQKVEINHLEAGADVSLDNLPNGTYVINIGNEKSVKVLKK